MICKKTDGDLSNERGSTQYATEVSSVQADGHRARDSNVRSHEGVAPWIVCGTGTNCGAAQPGHQPNIRALRAKLERRLEVRQAKGHFRCSCGHAVDASCKFLIDWDGDDAPISYCTGCAPMLLRALL